MNLFQQELYEAFRKKYDLIHSYESKNNQGNPPSQST